MSAAPSCGCLAARGPGRAEPARWGRRACRLLRLSTGGVTRTARPHRCSQALRTVSASRTPRSLAGRHRRGTPRDRAVGHLPGRCTRPPAIPTCTTSRSVRVAQESRLPGGTRRWTRERPTVLAYPWRDAGGSAGANLLASWIRSGPTRRRCTLYVRRRGVGAAREGTPSDFCVLRTVVRREALRSAYHAASSTGPVRLHSFAYGTSGDCPHAGSWTMFSPGWPTGTDASDEWPGGLPDATSATGGTVLPDAGEVCW